MQTNQPNYILCASSTDDYQKINRGKEKNGGDTCGVAFLFFLLSTIFSWECTLSFLSRYLVLCNKHALSFFQIQKSSNTLSTKTDCWVCSIANLVSRFFFSSSHGWVYVFSYRSLEIIYTLVWKPSRSTAADSFLRSCSQSDLTSSMEVFQDK